MFGGGVTESNMALPIMVILVVLGILILVLPRKYVIFPVLSGVFLIWSGSQLYLAGMHWLSPRIIILVGLLRMAISGAQDKTAQSRFAGGFNELDSAFLVCVVTQAVCVMLLFLSLPALNNQFGLLLDFLGGYFLLRFLIQDESDIYRALKCLALVSVILAAGMIVEQLRLKNYFALAAGFAKTPDIREGKIRSQGAFEHSIPAGTVAATWIPLFFLLWRNGKSKFLAVLGLVGASIMTYTSQSSTPLLAYAAGYLALAGWVIRDKMRLVRRTVVAALLGLSLVMKAPVWFIIAHIDLTGSSTGYHRAELVDQFIHHFWDWWLIGVKETYSWGYDLWDVQDQYVSVGETGGLLAFIFFIVLIARAFARIGNARKNIAGNKDQEWLMWFIGCSLFSNMVAYLGVNYFDQSKMSWFLILAFISAASIPLLHVEPKTNLEPRKLSFRKVSPSKEQPKEVAEPARLRFSS